MRDLSGLKALTFDYYGTLFNKDAVAALIEPKFPGKGLELARTWFRTTQEYCFLNGMMGRHQSWEELTSRALEHVFKEAGLSLDPAFAKALREADINLPPYPEVAPALARLATKFDLWVLSMGTPWMIETSQEKAGVKHLFKGLISAERAKVYKPSPGAYALATEALKLDKSQIGFVSSNSFDIMGSAHFGYPTFWLNRGHAILDTLGPTPDLEVANLHELADMLLNPAELVEAGARVH